MVSYIIQQTLFYNVNIDNLILLRNFGGRLLINAQPFFATAPVPSRFIVNTKPILSADVTSEVKEEVFVAENRESFEFLNVIFY